MLERLILFEKADTTVRTANRCLSGFWLTEMINTIGAFTSRLKK